MERSTEIQKKDGGNRVNLRLMENEDVEMKRVTIEGRGMFQSIHHIFISLPSPYPLSLCTLVPPDFAHNTHTHTHTH